MTILTKPALLERIKSGHIIADPELVTEASVDFTLGDKLWTSSSWSDQVVDLNKENRDWHPIALDELGRFILKPGKHYIAITGEAVGTRLLGDGVTIVPEMKARSTSGRHGISVALCAGHGDPGYAGQWAVELQNHNHHAVAIRPGSVIGQFVFHEATSLQKADGYGGPDRYQSGDGEISFLPKKIRVRETVKAPERRVDSVNVVTFIERDGNGKISCWLIHSSDSRLGFYGGERDQHAVGLLARAIESAHESDPTLPLDSVVVTVDVETTDDTVTSVHVCDIRPLSEV